MAIYFYSPLAKPYGCFSNFSRHPFELKQANWHTSEHYFQAQKFAGTEYEEHIRNAMTPKLAAQLGRQRDWPLRKDWEEVKDQIMFEAVLAKFSQNPNIKEILLATKEVEIKEKAPTDYYWGIGKTGKGRNQLGKCLMDVRKTLRPLQKDFWDEMGVFAIS